MNNIIINPNNFITSCSVLEQIFFHNHFENKKSHNVRIFLNHIQGFVFTAHKLFPPLMAFFLKKYIPALLLFSAPCLASKFQSWLTQLADAAPASGLSNPSKESEINMWQHTYNEQKLHTEEMTSICNRSYEHTNRLWRSNEGLSSHLGIGCGANGPSS